MISLIFFDNMMFHIILVLLLSTLMLSLSARKLRAGCNACQHLLSFIIWPRFERSSNSECIFTLLGSIFELGAQITSAHIHTSTNIHNNSVDYTAHYCRQQAAEAFLQLSLCFVGFCYNFPHLLKNQQS